MTIEAAHADGLTLTIFGFLIVDGALYGVGVLDTLGKGVRRWRSAPPFSRYSDAD
jgi:hypothetical protein